MRHPPQRCAAPTCPDSSRGQRLHQASARNCRKTFLHPAAMNAEARCGWPSPGPHRGPHTQQPGQIRISAGGGVARPRAPCPAVDAPSSGRLVGAGNRHRQDLLRVRSAPGRHFLPPPCQRPAHPLGSTDRAVLCGRAARRGSRTAASAHPFFTPARAGPQWREDPAAAPHDFSRSAPAASRRTARSQISRRLPARGSAGRARAAPDGPAQATITSLRRTLPRSGLAAIGCRRQGA